MYTEDFEIENETDYDLALIRIEELMNIDPQLDSEEVQEMMMVVDKVEDFERKYYSI
jgi:antitoxin component HigA of HigAB toxin-antitoxin module